MPIGAKPSVPSIVPTENDLVDEDPRPVPGARTEPVPLTPGLVIIGFALIVGTGFAWWNHVHRVEPYGSLQPIRFHQQHEPR